MSFSFTMMPGDSQSKTVVIASDATAGNCQNCSVLHQSLTEYVTSFLALKQKITISDDTIRLQQQLEELQMCLVTLEKKTADYESLQAELEEKKNALEDCGHMCEEMEKLKQENNDTILQNQKLENQLKELKELMENQSLENSRLKREKAEVENDLLKTQTSLRVAQAQADQVEKLMEENAKTTSIKDELANKVELLEGSVSKSNKQMCKLTKEKILLERNIDDLQARLLKLERERAKEYRSASTQARAPEEPKIDKEKVRMLLENLWACVEPHPHQSANWFHLQESNSTSQQVFTSSPPKNPSHLNESSPSASHSVSESIHSPKQMKCSSVQSKPSPGAQKTTKQQASSQRTNSKRTQRESPQKGTQLSKEHKPEVSPESGCPELLLEEIRKLFQPLPSCLSPLLDLDTVMESMEMGDTDVENHGKPSEEEPPHLKSLLIQTAEPNHRPPADDSGGVSKVPTQEMEHSPRVRDTRDLKQAEMKDKGHTTVGDEMHPQKEVEVEQEPATVQPLSSSSSARVLVEGTSAPSQESNRLLNPTSSSACISKDSLDLAEGEASTNQSDIIAEMDVDAIPGATGDTVQTSDDGESLTTINAAATEEAMDVQPLTPSACTDSVEDNKFTSNEEENVSEPSQGPSALELASLGTAVLNPGCLVKDSQDESRCMWSRNPFSRVYNQRNDELIVSVMGGTEEEAHRTTSVDESASPSLVDDGIRSPSLRLDNAGEGNVHKEADDAGNSEKAGNCVSNTEANYCKSLEENKAFLHRQLSPSCPVSTVNLEALESHSNPEEGNIGVNLEHLSSNPKTLPPNVQEELVEKAVEGLPQDKLKCCADIPNGQDTCLESMEVPEKPNQDRTNVGVSPADPGVCASPENAHPSQTIRDVRSEMGPPLPRPLTPLLTPPKTGKPINPRHAIGKLLFPSPMEGLASPNTTVQTPLTPSNQQTSSSSHNSPLTPNGVPSSPLQFGSATPKHAVPVPGRLPVTAVTSSPSTASSPSQENSMRMLDTMYPELSARARTLSILRGNLSIDSSEGGTSPSKTDSQMSGFKTINSTSTAFTKTEMRGEKRPATSLPQPNNKKCLRLESSSPCISKQMPSSFSESRQETATAKTPNLKQLDNENTCQSMEGVEPAEQNLTVRFLKKIENQAFDLLLVIRSHLVVGRLPTKPVLRDEEKEVIYEICQRDMAEAMISAILNKLKAEKMNLCRNYSQALCRVYTGICRQKRDWEKAHVLAYSILTEDFPDCAKLILFMVTTWRDVLSHNSCLCQAVHTVTKLKAQDELTGCLSAYLGWEKNPPCDIDQLISRTLSELRSGSRLSFTKHSRYGDDLGPPAWEQVFTLHLLCAHKPWKWTYENILGKELWPLMNAWVTQPRDQQAPISDATVATVLRLIGRLGQLGMKEGSVSAVLTVANVINTFGRFGQSEGVPWEVQLAAVYSIFDLSPCNPKQALDALAGWRGDASQSVPSAVTSCITQLASVCRQVKS